jgi:hypothetical protein
MEFLGSFVVTNWDDSKAEVEACQDGDDILVKYSDGVVYRGTASYFWEGLKAERLEEPCGYCGSRSGDYRGEDGWIHCNSCDGV